MHFVVKAPNLAHMYMTPKKKYLAIVPSQISPVGAVAAILKNGRYLTISQKLRGVALSLSTPYIGFLGRRFQKNYCRIYQAIVSAILEPIFKNGRHFQSLCLILETLRHRIVTLHISFMGNIIQIMRGYVHHTNVCIVGMPVVAIFCKY